MTTFAVSKWSIDEIGWEFNKNVLLQFHGRYVRLMLNQLESDRSESMTVDRTRIL